MSYPLFRKIIFFFSSAAIFCFAFTASGQARKKNPLNGKTFVIELTPVDDERKGWQWKKDEISFFGGRLSSDVMTKKEEFPGAKFTFTSDSAAANVSTFHAEHKNMGDSEIIWNGTLSGDDIEGTAEWTNLQGTFNYSFTGMLKGKKKK